MSNRYRQPLIGPVITTPPGAVPPVIIANPQLVPQPLQFPMQPAQYPTYYEVPYPDHFIMNPVDLQYYPRQTRFFPAPIPPLFPPVYGPFPPLFPPVPPPIYPYPAFPIIF